VPAVQDLFHLSATDQLLGFVRRVFLLRKRIVIRTGTFSRRYGDIGRAAMIYVAGALEMQASTLSEMMQYIAGNTSDDKLSASLQSVYPRLALN
jgi:hypothetical protein